MNLEIPLMFPACILCCKEGIGKSNEIKQQIIGRLKDWKKEKIAELVQCTVVTACRGMEGKEVNNKESIINTYHLMVAQMKMHRSVCVVSTCDGGGIYFP